MSYSPHPPPLPDKSGISTPNGEFHSSREPSVVPENVSRTTPIQVNRIEQLPAFVIDKRIQILNDLANSPEALKGIYESSEEGEKIFTHQQTNAHNNLLRARELIDKIEALKPIRQATQEKLIKLQELEQQWGQIENEMYRALQPFSMPALKSRLEYSVSEAESLSETLSASFLEGSTTLTPDGGYDNVAEFIRNYRKERKLYHLRNEQLERWKEDRVRRL